MTLPRTTVIGADALLFSELFYKGTFAVPWHQRYYDWNTSDVRVLLHDIDEAIRDGRRCYFLGAIMLVKFSTGKWEVNDGQQRMITVSLICAALCRRFARETNDSQREGHALRMLFNLDWSGVWSMNTTEHYEPRIDPPMNDRMTYRQMIRGKSFGTNGKLTAAWETIENFLGPTNSGRRWEQYFDYIREKLEVACLHVPLELDPNAVYETINCRGKQLDDLDLIRNLIYSYFNSHAEAQRKHSIHDSLEKIRNVFPSSRRASEYMRCRLQCRYGFLRSDNFYRDVRQAIREQRDRNDFGKMEPADYTFHLVQDIAASEDLELFRTLTARTPDPEFVHAFESAARTTKSARKLTVFLRELRGYTVTQPIVFALMSRYIREKDGRRRVRLAKLVNRNLSRLSSFVLRTAFVAPKFEPSHFETEFSNLAMRVASGHDFCDDEFRAFLKKCDHSAYGVLEDSRFIAEITQNNMRGSPKIKQFLLGINRHETPDAMALNEHQCSIEHILPVSSEHGRQWTGFHGVDLEDWIHRTGNLTLMSAADNKPGSKYNSSFANKQTSYKDSSVAMTRRLFTEDNWTPATIEKRQLEMAKIAALVWVFT